MKAGERADSKKAAGRSKAKDEAQAHDSEAEPASSGNQQGFLPKAQQLGSQAFRDGSKVMQDASDFVHTVQQIRSEAEHSISNGLNSQPYLVLGAAATVGFVLGRGLTFGMSRTLLGLGGKMAMSLLVKRVTANIL